MWNEYEALGRLLRDPDCPVCTHHQFAFLNAQAGAASSTLCGRNAVQVRMAGAPPLNLAAVERQMAAVAQSVRRNSWLLRAQIDGYEFTVFPDNRAILSSRVSATDNRIGLPAPPP